MSGNAATVWIVGIIVAGLTIVSVARIIWGKDDDAQNPGK
jgi:hypothetical protein